MRSGSHIDSLAFILHSLNFENGAAVYIIVWSKLLEYIDKILTGKLTIVT